MATTIQSQEQHALFDIIDKLRSRGLSEHIDLPDIVVCGDQSSGKISVLEAISGMVFPTKDNLCTRSATELVLRQDSETVFCTVSLMPDPKRSQKEQDGLLGFRRTYKPEELNLGDFIEAAKDAMGLSDAKRFSNDTLRVELTGPQQPRLTMVDLPGLFSAGNKDHSSQDAKIVRRMVLEHVKSPRSIILAVVSAKNEFVNQQVTTLTKRVDPNGLRTMGLIAKPDTLHRGSESERTYLDLAKSKHVKFRLGWHVLRNCDYPERNSSSEERDAAEAAFFAKPPWSSLDKSQCGVTTLKERLSEILRDQILDQLPELLGDVERGIKECETFLQDLGHDRSSILDQRRYLQGVSDGFTNLMDHTVEGTYGDSFFGDAMTDEGYAKRLRAVV